MTDDTVGLGIVGLGRWSAAHAEAAGRSATTSIVSCFSRTPERRTAFAEEFNVPEAAESLDRLLANEAVEAVIVSTPNDTHLDITSAAIAAGKPVLVDKPVAADVAQGLHLLRQTETGLGTCAVAHHARRLAGHRAMRRWLDASPGKPRLAHASFANNRGATVGSDSWKRRGPTAAAGVLTQVGIHQIDNLIYLLGPVQSVNARFSYGAIGRGIAESVALLMVHSGGELSTVTTGWSTPGHYRLELLTTTGNLNYRLDTEWWRDQAVDDHAELVLQEAGAEAATVPVESGDPLVEQLDELGRAARQGTPVEIGVAEGLRSLAVVQGAIASADRNGAAIDLADVLRDAGATEDETDLIVGRQNTETTT